jgi:hypothetical protein
MPEISAPVLPAAEPELKELPLEEATPEEMPPVEVPSQQT